MCIFIAFETMFILFIAELLYLDKGKLTETIKLAYFHEYTLPEILLIFLIFGAIPVSFAILSARFQVFYCLYDGLHCLLGIYILLGAFSVPTFTICFLLSVRFITYIAAVKGYSEPPKELLYPDRTNHTDENNSS